jgi:hypothetical protein
MRASRGSARFTGDTWSPTTDSCASCISAAIAPSDVGLQLALGDLAHEQAVLGDAVGPPRVPEKAHLLRSDQAIDMSVMCIASGAADPALRRRR